jgi:predicted MFS family arabinose efflux permease
MTSFWDLGILIAGPASGLIAAGYGFRAAFWTAATMPVVAVALSAGSGNKMRATSSAVEVAGGGRG